MTILFPSQSLDEFDSRAILPLAARATETYLKPLDIKGNSILSTVFVESIDIGASVAVKYYDSTTGEQQGERFNLEEHPTLTAASTTPSRILITKIHNKPVLEVTVTGGSATFGVYVTVVASFASDLDSALVAEGEAFDSVRSKAMPFACYDATAGTLHFVRCEDGKLLVSGITNDVLTTPSITNTTIATKLSEISVTLPLGTKYFEVTTRNFKAFRLAFASGETSTNYRTVKGVWNQIGLDKTASHTIYVASLKNNEVVEVLSYI